MTRRSRIIVATLGAVVLAGAVAGAAIVLAGLFNVSARAGHLDFVRPILHMTYKNSVRLRAPSEDEVPDLQAPGLALLGARHFELACARCHGLPGMRQDATIGAMLPQPPHVTQTMEDWEPRHLHWILQEGVKMSGMPHWPSRRSDDIWAVVAYLEAVRADEAPEPAKPATGLGTCTSCHGERGQGVAPQIPRLDILSEEYMKTTLRAYRDGTRESGIMRHVASSMPLSVLDSAARSFAAMRPGPARAGPDSGLARRGGAIAARGSRDVPACNACHARGGGTGTDQGQAGPPLAGQSAVYLETQLRLWRSGLRDGGARANLMTKAAQDLGDDQIEALAAHFASQTPERR